MALLSGSSRSAAYCSGRMGGKAPTVACRVGSVCMVARAHGQRVLMSQAVMESTSSMAAALPLSAFASPVQPTSDTSSSAMRFSSKEHQYDALVGFLDAAAAEAKKTIGKGAPELGYVVTAYVETLKQHVSQNLQVSPPVLAMPHPERAKQLLAHHCLMVLNKDNWEPTLNWTALDPALGVPLLRGMVNSGHADDFGMPVFSQQTKLPTKLTLPEFLKWEVKRPYFVGRFLENFWDDEVIAEPDPWPVIAVREMAEKLLTVHMLEAVLGGFAAGRRLLTLGRQTGLSSSVGVGMQTVKAASWWDLGSSHPAAVLGVLLMSLPEMPLAAFLRAAAAARGAEVARADALGMQMLSKGVDEVVPELGGFQGGRMWGTGPPTAVGAGDGDDGTACPMSVPVLEPRERERKSGFAHVKGERVRACSHVSMIRHLGSVLAKLFGAKRRFAL